jgi:peptidoglycan/xylan/chitin deacetylase (PgdA/CDA1 family)
MIAQAKSALYSALRVLPSGWADPAPLNGCLMPYYHMVADAPVPHVSELYPFPNVARFTADLEILTRGRRPITLAEFSDTVNATGLPPKNSLLLTFDDGFREMHDTVAPILEAKGIPATFFIITETLEPGVLCFQQKISLLLHRARHSKSPAATHDEALLLLREQRIPGAELTATLQAVSWAQREILDRIAPLFDLDFAAYARSQQPYLSPAQIETLLARGHAVGSHSISHPRYADLDLEEQLRQTRESMEILVARFALKHRAFAFPHTDRGVTAEFFHTLQRDQTTHVTFGTTGPCLDTVPASYQRFSMEKPLLPAAELLARQTARRLKLLATGKTKLQRN